MPWAQWQQQARQWHCQRLQQLAPLVKEDLVGACGQQWPQEV